MKEKFSIFQSAPDRTTAMQSSINFKKSPNKFVVYEPVAKLKQHPRTSPFQVGSVKQLDSLRKLPNDYSSLRQTLGFRSTEYASNAHEEEKDKLHKQSSILRQTLTMKPSFKSSADKNLSESYSGHEVQSSSDPYFKYEPMGVLGYSRKGGAYLGESKSWHSLYDLHPEPRTPHQQHSKPEDRKRAEQRQKWRTEQPPRHRPATHYPHEPTHNDSLLQQLHELKKLSSINNEEDEKPRMERKYSCNIATASSFRDSQDYVFKKKREENLVECYTPKVPKYTYDQRFKKVGSPTSTENSDSRSPPNKFIEVPQIKKRSVKFGMDDFIIGKTLGEGKFGVVMMAIHRKTGSLFALKKIPKAMIRSHLMVEQLALQIRLQSCLNHKNVLGMYGFFDDATHLFIVLEYMEQGTLYSQLKKTRILPAPAAANIIKQIAAAVEYLHDHDIAHRDIKPENIVISNNVCKLCDFGWATLCNERRKTYCGTFDYAAPEILQGKEYDMSVDLWCLGVLTYELLTGKAPFYHISRKETIKKILNVETQTITYPESMGADAVDFIERLVRKDPNDRMKAGEALRHPFLLHAEEP